jgi:flagellar hook-length control protein FliK
VGSKLSGASAVKAGMLGDGSFGALFSGAKTEAAAATAVSAPAALSASKDVDAKLAQAVKDLLDRGIALGDVIAHLASSLATSVAAQLGISPQAALQRLTQAFTHALQSNGTGPPGNNADRASALVSRFRRIAELATGVVNGDQGQPIRTIAGNNLDAATAKVNPAPTADSILRSALDALAAPAPPAPDPALAASARPAAEAAGDGRIVALVAPVPAIASGGDTPLGRILTRAMLLDTQPSAPAGAAQVDAPANRATNAAPAAMRRVALGDVNPNAVSNAIDAFMPAFENAVARNYFGPPRGPDGIDYVTVSPTPVLSPSIAIPSFTTPVARDTLPVAPLPPASSLPQPQHVDANAVVDQILRGMAIRTTDGQSEVRLRLVPENLGDVSVKLVVSGGSVDASIVAHTADAQSALAGGQNQLAKTLADAGLKLQSFTVGLAGDFAGNRDQSRPNDSQTRSAWRRIGGLESVDVDEPVDTALLAVPSFGPPIYAASPALRNLNYLV